MEESAIKTIIRNHISEKDAPGLLRLAFHDAGTFSQQGSDGGANGSITLDEELARAENDGLAKAAGRILDLKEAMADVSRSDIIAIAGAVAVEITGGPTIEVGVGRGDRLEPAPGGRLPDENDDKNKLLKTFVRMGLTAKDLVVLTGAHTIGDAHDKPFTDDRLSFNNSFFRRLARKGQETHLRFLPSDLALMDNDELEALVKAYGEDQDLFFKDFSISYKKMTWLGAS